MPSSCSPDGTETAALLLRLLDGAPWTARRIRSPYRRQHCRRLCGAFRRPTSETNALRQPFAALLTAIATQTRLLTDCHPDTWDATTVLLRLAAYHEQWRRDPVSWEPDPDTSLTDQWRSLVRHLLTGWPLPDCFENAWLVFGPLRHLERDWYCHVGRGLSLRTAAGMPRSISSRALHLATQAPAHFTIRQAVRYGQLQACQAGPALMEEVLASRVVPDFSNEFIWSRLLPKAASAPNLPAGTFNLIADTLAGMVRNGQDTRVLALLDQPLADLYRFGILWWERLAASIRDQGLVLPAMDVRRASCRADLEGLVHAVWEGLPGIDPHFSLPDLEGRGLQWTFHELTSLVGLMQEGRRLRHCVATYRRFCEPGLCSIFSLRQSDPRQPGRAPQPVLTLEINRAKRRIVQVRGKWNRFPRRQENAIIRTWASHHQLKFTA